MNIFDAYVSDRPSCFYKIDEYGTSFPNLAGDSRALISSVASDKSSNTPIVRGSEGPVLVGGSKTLKIPSDRLSPQTKNGPVSLECWVVLKLGPIEIMSHEFMGDGLVFDGESIKFIVNFENSDSAVARWQVPDNMTSYHLVGVYSGQKLSLYVNGIVEDEIDLTVDQSLDSLESVTEQAIVIGSSATQTMLIDAPAIYDYALSAEQVLGHYIAGSDVRDAIDNIMSFGGNAFTFDDNDRNVLYTQNFDLTSGAFVDTNSKDGVRPTFDDNGLSRAGTWTGSIPISLTGSTSLAGVKLDWNGDGSYEVEASLNTGSTWTAVENGRLIPGTEGLNTTGKEIDVRVTFAGGIENDISSIRDMYAVAYADRIIRSDNSNRLVVAGTGAVTSTRVSSPIESYQNAGLLLSTASATLSGGDTVQTIELWFKFNGPETGDIVGGVMSWDGTDLSVTGATLYLNGATSPVTLEQNEWVHTIVVLDDPTTNPIVLGSGVSIQIGLLGVYEAPLTADQVSRLYASYFGSPTVTVDEPGIISVQEVSSPYHLYDYNWQIVSGGR